VPKVEFELGPLPSDQQLPHISSTSSTNNHETTRLSRYLTNLTLCPNDPPASLADANLGGTLSNGGLSLSSSTRNLVASSSNSISIPTLALPNSSDENPESDSFAYLETLLESLAVLGKLGNALDVIMQRLPNEIYALIETTVDEVGERVEYNRRTSTSIMAATNPGAGNHSVYVFSGLKGGGVIPSNTPTPSKAHKSNPMEASRLRLTALESSSKQTDNEILRDLFWSVYSKLDAVLQGLRLVSEVSNRIGAVSALSCRLAAFY
jgi:exocyst complex component 4